MGKDINTVVDVQIDRLTKFPTRVGFGVPLIMDINAVQGAGAVDTFTEIQEMLDAGFGAADEAVLAATALVSQNPRPPEFRVAKREANVAKIVDINIDQIQNNTDYDVTLAGQLFKFTSDGDATDIEIRDGLIALIDADPKYGAVLVDADTLRVTGATAGVDFSVVLSANMSETANTAAVNAFTELARIQQVLADWYFLISTSRTEQDILDSASWTETEIKLYGTESDQADIKDLTVLSDATSIAFQLKAANRDRTFMMWTKTANLPNYPAAAWIGKLGPKDPGSVTWKFKSLSGPLPDDELTATELKNIEDKNVNIYVTIAGIATTGEGKVMSGEFIDIIRGTDKLQRRIQEDVFALLSNEDKVPFTDKGGDALGLQVQGPLDEAVADGLLVGGDNKPVVTVPKVADIPQAQRALREFGDIDFTATYAGAVHKAIIRGRISV